MSRSNDYLKISSIRVLHRAGSRDRIRWSPSIEGLLIERMSADHACHTITGSDEMKEKINDMSVEKWLNEFCAGENGRNSKKNLPDSVSSTMKSTWRYWNANSGPSGGRRETNRLRHKAEKRLFSATKMKLKLDNFKACWNKKEEAYTKMLNYYMKPGRIGKGSVLALA